MARTSPLLALPAILLLVAPHCTPAPSDVSHSVASLAIESPGLPAVPRWLARVEATVAGRGVSRLSGVLVGGVVITAAHGVELGGSAMVTLAESPPEAATVRAVMNCDDLAVLFLPEAHSDSATIGAPETGDSVRVLQFVAGVEFSPLVGVLRPLESSRTAWLPTSVYRFDGWLNPGGSGAPVVDREAHLLGVAVAGDTDAGAALIVPAGRIEHALRTAFEGEGPGYDMQGLVPDRDASSTRLIAKQAVAGSPAAQVSISAGEELHSASGDPAELLCAGGQLRRDSSGAINVLSPPTAISR